LGLLAAVAAIAFRARREVSFAGLDYFEKGVYHEDHSFMDLYGQAV
jgi:hypothetical protein